MTTLVTTRRDTSRPHIAVYVRTGKEFNSYEGAGAPVEDEPTDDSSELAGAHPHGDPLSWRRRSRGAPPPGSAPASCRSGTWSHSSPCMDRSISSRVIDTCFASSLTNYLVRGHMACEDRYIHIVVDPMEPARTCKAKQASMKLDKRQEVGHETVDADGKKQQL
jgi:hypothetical protein